MGCIQGLDETSSIDSPSSTTTTNNKPHEPHHHTRCETSDQASESTQSFGDNIAKTSDIEKRNKPKPINTHIQIGQFSSEFDTEANIERDDGFIMRKMIFAQSNSYTKQSILSQSITNTTMDGNILSHIQHNNIINNRENTIDEEEEETDLETTFVDYKEYNKDNYNNYNQYNQYDDYRTYLSQIQIQRNYHNQSPVSPAKPTPILEDNISNTLNHDVLDLYDDETSNNKNNQNISNIAVNMKSTPIIPYRTRSPSTPIVPPPLLRNDKKLKPKNHTKPIMRSKSHDPDKKKQNKLTTPNINKYAYNISKNAKINTNKNKRRLVHAKSKSIPQNLFSSTLNDYQNNETNTYQYLSQITHFDQNTLRLLHLRWNQIDTLSTFNDINDCEDDKDDKETTKEIKKPNGKLDINAIAQILGIPSHCILVKRLFDYMDEHRMGQLSFRVFARTMSILSDKATISEKCLLSFNLYDINNDNVIDKNELKEIINDLLKLAKDFIDPLFLKLIHSNSTFFINKLISNTMKLFDLDNNGNITYNAYCKFIQKNPRLLSPFTMDIEKLLDYEAEQRRMKRISLNSLKKKKLRQMVIGQDPKKKYNKKWKKPQFIKDMEKDQIQHVNSIHNADEICQDLFDIDNNTKINNNIKLNEINETSSGSNDSEMDEIEKKQKEEKEKQERMQRTIEFLYDD